MRPVLSHPLIQSLSEPQVWLPVSPAEMATGAQGFELSSYHQRNPRGAASCSFGTFWAPCSHAVEVSAFPSRV